MSHQRKVVANVVRGCPGNLCGHRAHRVVDVLAVDVVVARKPQVTVAPLVVRVCRCTGVPPSTAPAASPLPIRNPRRSVRGAWIERTYHRRRRQTALGRVTPIEYEAIMTYASQPG